MKLKITAILTLFTLLGASIGAKAQQSNYHIIDPSGKETINTNWEGRIYTITLVNNKATALCLNNKKVADADLPKYDSLINRIVTLVRRDEAQAEKDREQADRDRTQADRDREAADRDRGQADRDRAQAEKDREAADHDRAQAQVDQQQAQRDQQQAQLDRQQADRDRAQAVIDRQQAEEDRQRMRQLIHLLVEKKLIPDAASLKDLVLTDDELVINGKKASPEIHKEIKQQYSKWAHLGLSYGNRNDCCSGVHFHVGSGSFD